MLGFMRADNLNDYKICLYVVTFYIFYLCLCPELATSSIDWTQLCRFYLKTEAESRLRNIVLNKDRTMHNVHIHNNVLDLIQLG
jgi:hypothetical protein